MERSIAFIQTEEVEAPCVCVCVLVTSARLDRAAARTGTPPGWDRATPSSGVSEGEANRSEGG
jgi:hypothetical protein